MTSHSNTLASPRRPEFHAEWCITFGRPPPKHLSTSFMQRALGWEAQAKAGGGLPTEIKRALQSIAKRKQPKLAVPRKPLRMQIWYGSGTGGLSG